MVDYCCDDLRGQVEAICPDHPDPWDCADAVVVRLLDGSYGLPVHDGGSSWITISHCPWCGSVLPAPPD